MTEDELREIAGRLNAATYGPWNRSTHGFLVLAGDSGETICHLDSESNENHINDADFIAHAREDVCSLIREVRSLKKSQGELQDYEIFQLRNPTDHSEEV